MIIGALSHWSDRQADIICERLDHAKVRKGTRHWEGETKDASELKALDSSYVVEVGRWGLDLSRTLETQLRRKAEQEIRGAWADLRKMGAVTGNVQENIPVTGFAEQAINPIVNMINQATARQSRRVMDLIDKMDSEGASLTDIKKEVRRMISTRSSWHRSLAIVATTNAIESARQLLYSTLGDRIEKTWHTEQDHKVRPAHALANEQTVPAHAPFVVGGFPMDTPGDLKAPAELVINCRCWATYQLVR